MGNKGPPLGRPSIKPFLGEVLKLPELRFPGFPRTKGCICYPSELNRIANLILGCPFPVSRSYTVHLSVKADLCLLSKVLNL